MHWKQHKIPQFFAKYRFWKNQEIQPKKHFLSKKSLFCSFFKKICQKRYYVKSWVFWVAFSALRLLFWAIKINKTIFPIFIWGITNLWMCFLIRVLSLASSTVEVLHIVWSYQTHLELSVSRINIPTKLSLRSAPSYGAVYSSLTLYRIG